MAGETVLTIVGNLTTDPELRQTSNSFVANFTVASTARTFNRQSGQWEDGQALFMRCTAWRDLAEHVSKSLSKGMRVIVQGRLQQHSYQANDGSSRNVIDLQVDEIGPSLRYVNATVEEKNKNVNVPNGGEAATPQHTGFQGNRISQSSVSNNPVDPWSSSQSDFGGGYGEPDF